MNTNQGRVTMHDHEHSHCHSQYGMKCLSWSAVLAGALVAMGLCFLLNLFSMSIGLTVLYTSDQGLTSFAIGGLVALLIGTLVSLFVAGLVAGYIGRPYCVSRNLGILYGFTTWSLALILSILTAGAVSEYVTDYTAFITRPVMMNVQQGAAVTDNRTGEVTRAEPRAELRANGQEITPHLSLGSFIVFVIFALGAIAACIGGVVGMSCCDDACSGPSVRKDHIH